MNLNFDDTHSENCECEGCNFLHSKLQQTWGLIQSFYIDGGQLENYSKPLSFVLGYEVGEIVQLMQVGLDGRKEVHVENIERLTKIALENSCDSKYFNFKDGFATFEWKRR